MSEGTKTYDFAKEIEKAKAAFHFIALHAEALREQNMQLRRIANALVTCARLMTLPPMQRDNVEILDDGTMHHQNPLNKSNNGFR